MGTEKILRKKASSRAATDTSVKEQGGKLYHLKKTVT